MIHPANERHLDEILDIEKMVFTHPWFREKLKSDLILNFNTENWVFLKDEQVVGYLFGWKVMDEFHINNIAVHTAFQRRHIGQSLIRHLKARLIRHDIQRIYFEVSGGNKTAQLLYESLGFKQRGICRDYYAIGDHALLYNLELNANG